MLLSCADYEHAMILERVPGGHRARQEQRFWRRTQIGLRRPTLDEVFLTLTGAAAGNDRVSPLAQAGTKRSSEA